MSDKEKADFLEKLLADTDCLIELARSIRKHRDEEWLAEIVRYSSGWWVETVPIEDLVSHMRQWAKGEG